MKTAWVSFPNALYTQECAVKAAKKVLGSEEWRIDESTTAPKSCQLYLADYDCIPFEELHPGGYTRDEFASTSTVTLPQLSCYCIRKSLIRKNYLANSLHLARVKKASFVANDRIARIPLSLNGEDEDISPKTWVFEISNADELDELLSDDLYDMRDELQLNEGRSDSDRKWYILKPAMADRGIGIRMFNSIDALQDIFEDFDDEDEKEDDTDEDDDDSDDRNRDDNAVRKPNGTSIVTSQLRHFVIQEYIARPLLIQPSGLSAPHKFHIRAYVLAQGNLKVYLWDQMLALFAATPYEPPRDNNDMTSHLTNTCLQEDQEATVYLLQDLIGNQYNSPDGASTGTISTALMDRIRLQVGSVIAETFRACASADSINFQPWPYAWEIFGVDLLVETRVTKSKKMIKVWLLEVNAQPDFARSGDDLQIVIQGLFERALEITVLGQPFEGGVGSSSKGMTLCLDMPMTSR